MKILFSLLLLIASPVLAQESDSAQSDQILMDYMTAVVHERFLFDRPDASFDLLDDSSGFQNAANKATIKFIMIPGGYDKVVRDFRKPDHKPGRRRLDSAAFSQPRTGFRVVEEMIAPPGENVENFIVIMTVFPFKKNVTVAMIGAYPKSQDAVYRKRFIDAALTLKHSNDMLE